MVFENVWEPWVCLLNVSDNHLNICTSGD